MCVSFPLRACAGVHTPAVWRFSRQADRHLRPSSPQAVTWLTRAEDSPPSPSLVTSVSPSRTLCSSCSPPPCASPLCSSTLCTRLDQKTAANLPKASLMRFATLLFFLDVDQKVLKLFDVMKKNERCKRTRGGSETQIFDKISSNGMLKL